MCGSERGLARRDTMAGKAHNKPAAAGVTSKAVGTLCVLLVLGILFFGLSDVAKVRSKLGTEEKLLAGSPSGEATSAAASAPSSSDDAIESLPALPLSEEANFGKFKKPNVKMGPFSYFKQIEPRANMTVCGMTYAEEPSVRVTTEADHRCKCYATHCNDIDYPTHSYVMLGISGKNQPAVKAAMEKVSSGG